MSRRCTQRRLIALLSQLRSVADFGCIAVAWSAGQQNGLDSLRLCRCEAALHRYREPDNVEENALLGGAVADEQGGPG
jgi:hypothetical protein